MSDSEDLNVSHPDALLRPDQVAKMFNVSVRTVTYWAWTGRLPAVKTPGGHYRFRPVDVYPRLTVPREVA